MMTILLLLGGLVLLVAGAEGLVRGASRLASACGVSALVIGLTIVAYGTSAPELVVSLKAAWAGQGDIAVGNVVGSNIFNVLFILGISAMITPLVVHAQLVRIDVPIMIGVSLLLWWMALDGSIGRVEGLILLALSVVYTVFAVRKGRSEPQEIQQQFEREYGNHSQSSRTRMIWVNLVLILLGLGGLVLGARWFLAAAVDLARQFGVSELVIALTIVAAGTSLPEVATSIMAALRGQRDIAIGNVVGSNIFNIIFILGASGVVRGDGVAVAPAALRFDIPVMVAVAVACLPIFFTGHKISRWEGAVFVGYYVAYAAYLILDATGHDALAVYSRVMMIFVLPITVLTLGVVAWRAWGKRGEQGHIEPQRTAG